jgi:Mu transposase, C-terminal domain
MVTDEQVRRLRAYFGRSGRQAVAAAKAGMSEKTASKYLRSGLLPSERRPDRRTWRTRPDPFSEVWAEVAALLEQNPGLQAVTILGHLQRSYPGQFQDGQLRTLQRRVKVWHATVGPPREVFFAQRYEPGALCQSDFTHMSRLGVTIAGSRFDHLIYHFVLPYSNWETGTICFSESFESLSEGLQNALWELGGVPRAHRTDRLSTAVHKVEHPEEFKRRYRGLLSHYGLEPRTIQAAAPHENGDVEQAHRRFKQSVEQALMLRGSLDFEDRDEYAAFLRGVYRQNNAGRRERFEHELVVLRTLPAHRWETRRRCRVRVGQGSTIRVAKNTYSVHSRLRDEWVEARLGMEDVEIWYGQRKVDAFPRLRGEGKHRIQYRHVIDWLVRKPGAFENYRYREDLFPTSTFRMAYDLLRQSRRERAAREYLQILHLAAREGEARVESILRGLLLGEGALTAARVTEELARDAAPPTMTEVTIEAVDLTRYDRLLSREEEACAALS